MAMLRKLPQMWFWSKNMKKPIYWELGNWRITLVDSTVYAEIHIYTNGLRYKHVYSVNGEAVIETTGIFDFIAQLKSRPELLVALKGNKKMRIIDDFKDSNLDNLSIGDIVVAYDNGDGVDDFAHYLVSFSDENYLLVELTDGCVAKTTTELDGLKSFLIGYFDNAKIVNAELKLTDHE